MPKSSSASMPSAPSIRRSMTPSPASRTGRSSMTGSSRRCSPPGAKAVGSPCSCSTSTASRRSTTRSATHHHDPIRLTLVGELRKAIDERELVLYYQPKAAMADGAVKSVEALLRWFHPERGLIPPDEFIPQAQETGLMKPLTLYVLNEALVQLRSWLDAGLELGVAVNVATRNLIDTSFPDDLEALLARVGVAPSRLEIEITESTTLDDPVRTKLVLDRLHELGVRLSIDDF